MLETSKKNYKQLVLKYLDLNVVSGRLCELCQKRLLTIEQKCADLKQFQRCGEHVKGRAAVKRLCTLSPKKYDPVLLQSDIFPMTEEMVCMDTATLNSAIEIDLGVNKNHTIQSVESVTNMPIPENIACENETITCCNILPFSK